jgi:hypothetical protein
MATRKVDKLEDDSQSLTPTGGFMLWPIIKPGLTTMVYAMDGCGKTNFMLAMSASIVAGVPFLKHRCWSVPVNFSDARVIYFDFESKSCTEETESDFVSSILSEGGKETERSSRFHRINMNQILKDANITNLWEKKDTLFKLMLRCVDERLGNGDFKGPVLVVVDNYMAMIGGADAPGRWGECDRKLFEKMTSRGAALVVVNHAAQKRKVAGYKASSRTTEVRVFLEKDHGGSGGVIKNINVEVEKGRLHKVGIAYKDFFISFNNGTLRWELDDGQDRVDKFLTKLCVEIQGVKMEGKKLSVTEIGEMVGVKRSTANGYVNKFRTKPGGPIDLAKLDKD